MKAKPQNQKIKLIAKQPKKVKTAIKAWVQDSEKKNSDPLGLDEAPEWVTNAFAEAVKTTLPGNRLPTAGEWDMELLGELLGRQQALAKLYSGEIPMGPEMMVECERLEKFVVAQPQTPEIKTKAVAVVQDMETMMAATHAAIPPLLASVMDSSHEDALKFQKGLLRGMTLAPDELTAAKTFQRHTRTYFVLGLQWRTWVKCKSLREVHGHLCRAVGEQKIGSFRTFEKICEKIGFKLRGRGRPAGSP